MTSATSAAAAHAGQGELAGRCAIVSGASRGVGLASAHRLAQAGAGVIMTGRDAERGERAAASVREQGGKAVFVRADQGDEDGWRAAAAAARDSFGRLDILVLNAGVSEMARTADLSLEDFRRVSRTNLRGPFLGMKYGVEAIRAGARGGSVVMIASIAGRIGVVDHIHYTASKAGVGLLAKAAALELGPEKIRVNTILPGFVRTDMTARFPEEARLGAPLGRAAEPEEIAEAVCFLASERSAFMTGAEMVIDGGWTAR